MPARILVQPMIRADQPKVALMRPAPGSKILRISTVTSHQFRPRLGRSLPPLGKTLVSILKREPRSQSIRPAPTTIAAGYRREADKVLAGFPKSRETIGESLVRPSFRIQSLRCPQETKRERCPEANDRAGEQTSEQNERYRMKNTSVTTGQISSANLKN